MGATSKDGKLRGFDFEIRHQKELVSVTVALRRKARTESQI